MSFLLGMCQSSTCTTADAMVSQQTHKFYLCSVMEVYSLLMMKIYTQSLTIKPIVVTNGATGYTIIWRYGTEHNINNRRILTMTILH